MKKKQAILKHLGATLLGKIQTNESLTRNARSLGATS